MSLRARIGPESPAFTSLPLLLTPRTDDDDPRLARMLARTQSSFQTGRPVVLALTASWCPHCIRFKPTVKAASDEAVGRECCSIACVDVPKLHSTNPRLYAALVPLCTGYPTVVCVVRDGARLQLLATFHGHRNVQDLLLFASEQTTPHQI